MDENVPDNSVIFIGDSITQGLAVSAVANPSVNYGIGGDTTVGVLKRVQSYASLDRASVVVIAVGINDFSYRSNEKIFDNIKSIVKKLPISIPIVISAILPIDEKIIKEWSGYNSRIVMLNSKVKDFTDKSNRLFFVDIGDALVDNKGNFSDKYHVGDGLHLNSRGNDIWIGALQEVISSK
jgi:lysophospholipase L1-like esterase